MSFHSTPFSQTLSFIPRLVFQKLELRHKTGRASRKFGFKEQFTVMAFIQLASRRSMRDGTKLRLRRVGYRDRETGKHYVFLTNHFKLSPKTIADIYKDRWQIELFFKEIKQNLRIKHFVGNTENAVLIQLYTALTVYLLLAYQKFLSRISLSIQQILQIIQLNLFGTTSLEDLLNPRRRHAEHPYDLSLLTLCA